MKKIPGYVPKSVTDVICSFHFGLLCVFYPPTPHLLPPPPLTVQKTKIKKKKKKNMKISSFYTSVPKIMIMMYGSWDGQTDRWRVWQKKWHMEVGASPKNFQNFQNEINYYNKHIPEANRLMKKLTREVFNLYFIYKTS